LDPWKKSTILGALFLLALAAAAAALAASGSTTSAEGEAAAGTVIVEKEKLQPGGEPENTGRNEPEQVPSEKSLQPATQPAAPDHTAGEREAKPSGAAEPSTVDERPASPQPDPAKQAEAVQPAAEPSPSETATGGGEAKSSGTETTAADEAQPGGVASDSAQESAPSQPAAKQQPGTPPATVTGTGEGETESAQPDRQQTVSTDDNEAATSSTETEQSPTAIEPDFVRALTGIATGRNDSNPVWSPSGSMIAFERSIGDNREIIVARSDGSIIQKIQCRPTDDDSEMEFFMPGIVDETSYNSGISWSPDEKRLVFMSNGGSGNYDLYLLPALGQEHTVRLTENSEKDSHPHWSPIGERLAFVSGRTGKAEIYLMDLVSRRVSVLTNGTKTYLYPQWSPDGARLALIYGSNENHDIYLIEDLRQPSRSLKALTTWQYDDLRPAWSPDGSKIAFYSNYNPASDPKMWSIIVVAADGSGPTAGEQLAARVVARNVVPDVERGPAWMPDSRRIAFVRNDPKAYNPIYIAHIDNGSETPLRTQTKMNHDVVCSKNGTLAFRSQTEQWDHIYIARLKEEVARREPQ
jgi:Tol biopolymer transport system component